MKHLKKIIQYLCLDEIFLYTCKTEGKFREYKSLANMIVDYIMFDSYK